MPPQSRGCQDGETQHRQFSSRVVTLAFWQIKNGVKNPLLVTLHQCIAMYITPFPMPIKIALSLFHLLVLCPSTTAGWKSGLQTKFRQSGCGQILRRGLSLHYSQSICANLDNFQHKPTRLLRKICLYKACQTCTRSLKLRKKMRYRKDLIIVWDILKMSEYL